MVDISTYIIKKVISSIFGALKGNESLKEHGKILLKKVRGDITKYNQERNFWRDVIGSNFYHPAQRTLSTGKAVELRNFRITEWFPRCPGLVWTSEAQRYRKSALDYVWEWDKMDIHRYTKFVGEKLGVFTPIGKTKMVLGGLGTTRLEKIEKSNSETSYRILCATSSGICDQGIPLIVTEEVYDKFNEQLTHDGVITANMTGFYSELPIDWKTTIIKVPGSEDLSHRLYEELQTTLHVPRHCVVIKSKRSVKETKEILPEVITRATAWTLFKFGRHTDDFYSFAFAYFNPQKEENINKAAEFLVRYVGINSGKEIYTDFDLKIRRLRTLSSKIRASFIDKELTPTEQQQIVEWAFSHPKTFKNSALENLT